MASPTPQALKVFRETFPEITEDKYPDAAVRIRLSLADKFFAVDRLKTPKSAHTSWVCMPLTI